MTTKRRQVRAAAKKKRAFIVERDAHGITMRILAGEPLGRYIETLQRDAKATGNRGPLDAYYQTIADALTKSALEDLRRVHAGQLSARDKLRKREARVALIRERFDPQPDRAACIALRVQVQRLLIAEGHDPSENSTYQIDEIVEALVTQLS